MKRKEKPSISHSFYLVRFSFQCLTDKEGSNEHLHTECDSVVVVFLVICKMYNAFM